MNIEENKTLEERLKELDEKIAKTEDSVEEVDPTHYIFEKAKLYIKNKMKEEALIELTKVIEKTQSFNLKIDSIFEILHIGIQYKDPKLLEEYIEKCRKLLKDGGDWEKRNRLKVYDGLFKLMNRNFKDSGKLFLEALMTFTNYELFDYKTFVFYTCITNIITVDRVTLKNRIIDNSDVVSCIREIPNLQNFLESFYNGNYQVFFYEFNEIIERTKNDFFLSKHNNYFVNEMRIKAYSQFLQSYKSVTIENMANCFGVSPQFIDM
jgi:26S proteasome regulatory subunit N7